MGGTGPLQVSATPGRDARSSTAAGLSTSATGRSLSSGPGGSGALRDGRKIGLSRSFHQGFRGLRFSLLLDVASFVAGRSVPFACGTKTKPQPGHIAGLLCNSGGSCNCRPQRVQAMAEVMELIPGRNTLLHSTIQLVDVNGSCQAIRDEAQVDALSRSTDNNHSDSFAQGSPSFH